MATVGWILLYTVLGLLGAFLLFVLFIVVSALCIDLNKQYENDSRFYRVIIRIISTLIVRLCRVHIHATGAELLPDEPFLLVCNHRSSLDPVAMISRMPKQDVLFICKPEVFRIPAAGPYLTRIGYLPIDRENARNALATINEAARRIRDLRYAVGVFPEGHRTKDGRLLPFHDGVFKIAQKARAPVAVAVVRGSEEVRRRAPWRPTSMTVEILELIPAEEVGALRTHQLADRVRQRMIEALPEERE